MTAWYCYVARPLDCECIAAVTVDEPEHAKDVAKDVANWVRRGFRVDRMTGDVFREMSFRCPEHPEGRW